MLPPNSPFFQPFRSWKGKFPLLYRRSQGLGSARQMGWGWWVGGWAGSSILALRTATCCGDVWVADCGLFQALSLHHHHPTIPALVLALPTYSTLRCHSPPTPGPIPSAQLNALSHVGLKPVSMVQYFAHPRARLFPPWAPGSHSPNLVSRVAPPAVAHSHYTTLHSVHKVYYITHPFNWMHPHIQLSLHHVFTKPHGRPLLSLWSSWKFRHGGPHWLQQVLGTLKCTQLWSFLPVFLCPCYLNFHQAIDSILHFWVQKHTLAAPCWAHFGASSVIKSLELSWMLTSRPSQLPCWTKVPIP